MVDHIVHPPRAPSTEPRSRQILDIRDDRPRIAARALELALAATGATRGGVFAQGSPPQLLGLTKADLEHSLRRSTGRVPLRHERLGTAAAISAPLWADDELLGVITVARATRDDAPFDSSHAHNLTLVAQQTALALLAASGDTARSSHEVGRVERLTYLLRAIAVAANEAESVKSAFPTCLRELCRELGWPVGHAVARDPEQSLLVRLDIWHAEDFAFLRDAQAASQRVANELMQRVLASGDPAWCALPPHVDGGLRGALAFPVLIGSDVAGVLEFFSTRAEPPSRALLEVMASVGAQLGRVVERGHAREREARAAAQLETANRELVRANALKSEFLAMVSHELSTPLTPVLGYADILTERWNDLDDGQRRDAAEIIAAESHHLAHLVDELVTMSQIEFHVVSVRPEPVRIAEVVASAQRRIGSRADRVAIDCAADAVAWADPHHVLRITEHYLRNALTHGTEPIVVSARRVDDEVIIRVADAGPGVAPNERADLFERFWRGHPGTDHRPRAGLGLGLAVARGLAEALGGRAWYEPNAPVGSCFFLALPAASAT